MKTIRLTIVAAAVLLIGADTGGAGQNAKAVAREDNVLLAAAEFDHSTDSFWLWKGSTGRYDHRVYVDYEYTRVNNKKVEGRIWGLSKYNHNVRVKGPNFGEGREVRFQVCVQRDWAGDPCSPKVKATA